MRLALLCLVLAACSQPAVESPSGDRPDASAATPDDLAAAQALWAEAELDGYTLTITRSCFCPPEWRGPYTVAVEDGATTSVTYEGAPVSQGVPPTVEGLFDLLEEAYAEGAARVTVTYHETLGYPVRLYIDKDERIADEEIGYEVSDLTPRN